MAENPLEEEEEEEPRFMHRMKFPVILVSFRDPIPCHFLEFSYNLCYKHL